MGWDCVMISVLRSWWRRRRGKGRQKLINQSSWGLGETEFRREAAVAVGKQTA